MPDDHRGLVKLPYGWEEDDAEQAKRKFHELRPAVPAQLVHDLLRYWLRACPDRMLFENEEDNRALAVHAQAHGQRSLINSATNHQPMAMLARWIEEEGKAPLLPKPLAWGPRAALAPQVRAAPASTLVRAWVTVDDHGPVEVLVVGVGLPEIRHEVVDAALRTSLRINGLVESDTGDLVEDFIGVGLIRLKAGLSGTQAAMDIPSVFPSRRLTVPGGGSSTAQGALREFVAVLRKLERATNLVQVTEIRRDELDRFDERIRSLAERAAAEPQRAFLRSMQDTPSNLVGLLPYLRTTADGAEGTSVWLELNPDILSTTAYGALELAHQRATTHRLGMDAKLRRDRLNEEIAWLKDEREAFLKASPTEQRAYWDATVLLTERFDEELALTIRLTEPDEMETKRYYETNVPNLIKLREEAAKRYTELADALDAAISSPHAPVRQLAAGRFLDAALRGLTPDESPATRREFETWRREIQPMLWFEWRSALATQSINPADLFTRHTVLVTRYLPAQGSDDAALITLPYTIVDEARSAVLADADRGVLVIRDATDHAEVEPVTDDEATAAESAWEELVRLAERADTKQDDFADAFLRVLRAHPKHIARRMIEELRPGAPGQDEADTIADHLRKAERAASLADGMARAVTAAQAEAFLTARECLDAVHSEPRWEARAWLLRAIVECLAVDMPSRDVPEALSDRMPDVPAKAYRALEEALSLDEKFTGEWLKALPQANLSRGIRRLFQGLPRTRTACRSDRTYAVLLFRKAVESARLARQLEEAAAELSEKEEAIDAVLEKMGHCLEEVLVGPFVADSRGEASSLLDVLTRRDSPRYGKAVN